MNKLLFVSLVVFGISFTANAQSTKKITSQNQLWFAYFTQARVYKKWGLWGDFHIRTKDNFVDNLSQNIIRLGVSYNVNNDMKVTAGYAHNNSYPAEGFKKTSRPEHSYWQQALWQTRYGKSRMTQRFRLEERFRRIVLNDSTLTKDFTFNYRMQYNLGFEIPLSSKGNAPKSFSLMLSEEVGINFGKQIVYNYFDMNRVSVGLKYQIDTQNSMQLSYMNQFQQLSAGNRYRTLHVIRLYYFQNFNLENLFPLHFH